MNNQTNNCSSSSSSESDQKMVETSTSMHHDNQMIIAQDVVYRHVNAIKAYSVKQEEWKANINYCLFKI